MSYQVTARKWRPMVFEDVVGQAHVTETLRNALKTNRVAHAYIFSGTRGCGKTTTARILARALNCLSPAEHNPDNTCEVCQEIIAGRGMDVIEIDGASNRGVEEIRNLRESVRYTPTRGKFKIYIIDEVHMLTKEAFNALLKTLEEPPTHVVFIFATTEIHKVPMTILSRCQRFDFRRISIEEITTRLRFIAAKEQVEIDDNALMVIAKKGDGSMRDAQSIFDQVRSFCGNTISAADVMKALNVVDQELYFRVSDLFLVKDARGGIQLIDELLKSGYDLREFVGGLSEHLRNLLVVKTTDSAALVETSEPFKKRYQTDAQKFSEQDLLRLLKQTNDLEQSMRWAAQPRYKLEAALLQMIKMEKSVEIGSLLQQLDTLKKKLENGSLAVPPTIANSQSVAPMRVVGSVGARPLSTASAIPLSSFVKSQSAEPLRFVGGRTGLAAPTQSESSLSLIGRGEVEARWAEFVSDIVKARVVVGSTLSESQLLDAQNGYIRVACSNDYHLSLLKRNKEFLAESFQKLTGSRVVIEPVMCSGNHSPDTAALSGWTTASAKPSDDNQPESHALLEVLKRELGAERIE
ncbi:MAG: DNA polymerase III subunit gamma/tau [Ignavibacteriales bacterium]|nr:DNA polymerase III subunit gamma/tau [Ignavibacteriales bacterium]